MERSTQGVVEGTRLSDAAGTALGEIDRVTRQLTDLVAQISQQALSRSAVGQRRRRQHPAHLRRDRADRRGHALDGADGARAVAHRRGTEAVGVAIQDRLSAAGADARPRHRPSLTLFAETPDGQQPHGSGRTADHGPDRRPQLDRLGPRGAAPLARGRAQVAAPLPEGRRGRHRLRHRFGRSGRAARGALADPPGRRRARAGRPAGGGDRPARQRDGGPARDRQAAVADARARLRPRARVVRPARLPGAPARRQAGLVAVAVPAVPRGAGSGRGRARPSGRPLGRSTGAGATSPSDPDVVPRQADADRARRVRRPAAGADARHADAHRGGAR